jgi:hypothetical protein
MDGIPQYVGRPSSSLTAGAVSQMHVLVVANRQPPAAVVIPYFISIVFIGYCEFAT